MKLSQIIQRKIDDLAQMKYRKEEQHSEQDSEQAIFEKKLKEQGLL